MSVSVSVSVSVSACTACSWPLFASACHQIAHMLCHRRGRARYCLDDLPAEREKMGKREGKGVGGGGGEWSRYGGRGDTEREGVSARCQSKERKAGGRS